MNVKNKSADWQLWLVDSVYLSVFQWGIIILSAVLFGFYSDYLVINILLSGSAIALPCTILTSFLGIRIFLDKNNDKAVFIGHFIKMIFSIVLLIIIILFLQSKQFIWQGFFIGLVGATLSPIVYGLIRGFIK